MVDIRAEKATVKWQKPDDWQGSDITGYTLEKMDMVILFVLIQHTVSSKKQNTCLKTIALVATSFVLNFTLLQTLPLQ